MIRKAIKHIKVICRHKAYVFRECRACGIWWQGITHDLSKFSPAEFIPSAMHFQGDRSPNDGEREDYGYSRAWLHHKAVNKHHWEYWTEIDDEGNVVPVKIPSEYVIEMICDWIGAGMAYSGEKWTQEEPIRYYQKARKGRYFHQETEWLILILLATIRDDGLERFHARCRKHSPLIRDYEKGKAKYFLSRDIFF